MTPMQKLKPFFDDFKSILPLSIKEVSLNKSSPSTYVDGATVYENIGVKSDFIKIFNLKFNDKDAHSLGFIFSYLEIPPEEHSVKVVLKIGTKEPLFLESKYLSIIEFKDMFSNTIKNIKSSKETNFLKMVDFFKKDFSLKQKVQKRPRKTKNRFS